MKTKWFKFGFLACLLVPFAVALTSCDKDDDDDGGGGGGTNKPIPDSVVDGVRIASVDDYWFEYGENGCLAKAYADDYDFQIGSNFSSMSASIEDGECREQFNVSNIRFNSSGYVTSLSFSSNHWHVDEDYRSTYSGSTSYSYDAQGHLINAKFTYSGYDIEDGEKESYSGSIETTFKYSGNNITEIRNYEKEIEDGDVDEYTEVMTFSGSTTDNKYALYDPAGTRMFDDEISDILAYSGYLGKYSAKLYSNVRIVETEDGDRTYNETRTYSYNLNSNGTIRSVSSNYSTYNYMYTWTYPNRLPETRSAVKADNGKADGHRSLIRRHKAQRNH